MENEKENKISEEIIGKIKRGEIKMLSKNYLLMKSAIFGIVSLFVVMTAAFFLVLVFYILKINGFINMSCFGLKGIRDMILSLPILLFALAILFVIAAAMFLHEYPATYRRPLIYSVGGLLVIFSAGLLVFTEAVSLRRAVYNEIETGEIPLVSSFFDYIKEVNPRNVYKGRVVKVYANSITFNAENEEEILRAAFGPQTSIYADEPIKAGDYVIIHGRKNGNTIGVFVVEKIEE